MSLVNYNNKYYFNSKDVKVFPASFRGDYEITSGEYKNQKYVFDPEARLNTEANYINAGRGGQSYIISWDADDSNPLLGTLTFVLNGYYFEVYNLNLNELVVQNGNTKVTKSFWITLREITLKADTDSLTGATDKDSVRVTKVLNSFEDTGGKLDTKVIANNAEVYIFTGLLVAEGNNVGDAGLTAINLVVDSSGNVVPQINYSAFMPNIKSGEGYYKDSSDAKTVTAVVSGRNNRATADSSIAIGIDTTAAGEFSLAAGDNTTALSKASHAEGKNVTRKTFELADKTNPASCVSVANKTLKITETADLKIGSVFKYEHTGAHATYYFTVEAINTATNEITVADSGSEALALLISNKNITFSIVKNVAGNTDPNSEAAHAEGIDTTASGKGTHAEGNDTLANADYAHAEGIETVTYGDGGHSEGYNSTVNNDYAHAEGVSSTANGEGSHVEGNLTVTNGDYAHAEGHGAEAAGESSHAEGYNTLASGQGSHAEGNETVASDDYAHAEGNNTEANGEAAHSEGIKTVANEDGTHAEGYKTKATSKYAHAEGIGRDADEEAEIEEKYLIASGEGAHAEGYITAASGEYSHAEGEETIASSKGTHAEGFKTTASGEYAHAEGHTTNASGNRSHAEGNGTSALGSKSHTEGDGTLVTGNGTSGHAEGVGTKVNATGAHAEGYYTIADGEYAHAEGYRNKDIDTNGLVKAGGKYSHTEGYQTKTSGDAAHAEGSGTNASGNKAHAEGTNTTASGISAHTEGTNTTASAENSHAEGNHTIASGTGAHSEGTDTTASGSYSHAEGNGTKASGNHSLALGLSTEAEGESAIAGGQYTKASGKYSAAFGNHTEAADDASFVCGEYSTTEITTTNETKKLFVVGSGKDGNNLHNAFEVVKTGENSTDVQININGNSLDNAIKSIILDSIYPVGSIFVSVTQRDDTKTTAGYYGCPIATLLGGNWERIEDTFLYAAKIDDATYGPSGTNLNPKGSKDAHLIKHSHGGSTTESGITINSTTTLNSTLYTGRGEYSRDTTRIGKDGNGNGTDGIITIQNGYTGEWDKSWTSQEIQLRPNQWHKPNVITVNADHTHSANSHSHTINTDGDVDNGTGLNMPPFVGVYMWRRVG